MVLDGSDAGTNLQGREESPLGVFPFGLPLRSCAQTRASPHRCFVLGAYPSALHVQWKLPGEVGGSVRALAIDNEPEPFWSGQGEDEKVSLWLSRVGWDAKFGEARPAGRFNGSSGRSVDDEVLRPFGISRSETWLSDCLDTYHLSDGMNAAIKRSYNPLAARLNLPAVSLPAHPDTQRIVNQAQPTRLVRELHDAKPEMIVTLGEAALEVMRTLLNGQGPTRLEHDAGYGSPVAVEFEGRRSNWYPLVHPGQRRAAWRTAHKKWMASNPQE